MKLLVIAIFIFLIACDESLNKEQEAKNAYSLQQKQLTIFSEKLKDVRYASTNELQKKELKLQYLDSIKSLLTDSFKYILPNFKLKVYDIDVVDLGNGKAFVAKFHDNDGTEYSSVSGIEYWMEFDYTDDKVVDMEKNPAYKLLKNIPEKADTTLSLFYLGEIETDALMSDQLRIRVVPFPKNYNFDSSQKANLKK